MGVLPERLADLEVLARLEPEALGGAVFRARDAAGAEVAVKTFAGRPANGAVLPPEGAVPDGVAPVLEVDLHGDPPRVVSEVVTGRSLADLAAGPEGARLPPTWTLVHLDRALGALAALHDAGLVAGRMAPGHVLIEEAPAAPPAPAAPSAPAAPPAPAADGGVADRAAAGAAAPAAPPAQLGRAWLRDPWWRAGPAGFAAGAEAGRAAEVRGLAAAFLRALRPAEVRAAAGDAPLEPEPREVKRFRRLLEALAAEAPAGPAPAREALARLAPFVERARRAIRDVIDRDLRVREGPFAEAEAHVRERHEREASLRADGAAQRARIEKRRAAARPDAPDRERFERALALLDEADIVEAGFIQILAAVEALLRAGIAAIADLRRRLPDLDLASLVAIARASDASLRRLLARLQELEAAATEAVHAAASLRHAAEREAGGDGPPA